KAKIVLIQQITYAGQAIIMILAYTFNILLIFIVRRSANKEIGTYRILITYFALSDIYYTTVHFVVYPIPENYGNAFFMRGHGFYRELLGAGLYMGAYGHAFPILIFHFLYRLLAIKYPELLRYFKAYLFALVIATVASNALWFSIFYWFFHPDQEILHALAPVYNGSVPLPVVHTFQSADQHSQALYWTGETYVGPRWRNLIGAIIMCLSMLFSYSIIIRCCFLINKYLKDRMKSEKSIQLHRQLFRSLIYQSFVPLITAYYPAGTAVLLPIFGLTITFISIAVPPACGTHPLFDPILLILTITEYRQAFFKLVGISRLRRTCKSHSIGETSASHFTRASA
ncbi:hypothetical protein PENTCL1PPCAC_15416, partial [Pristionchus entomophagus]